MVTKEKQKQKQKIKPFRNTCTVNSVSNIIKKSHFTPTLPYQVLLKVTKAYLL